MSHVTDRFDTLAGSHLQEPEVRPDLALRYANDLLTTQPGRRESVISSWEPAYVPAVVELLSRKDLGRMCGPLLTSGPLPETAVAILARAPRDGGHKKATAEALGSVAAHMVGLDGGWCSEELEQVLCGCVGDVSAAFTGPFADHAEHVLDLVASYRMFSVDEQLQLLGDRRIDGSTPAVGGIDRAGLLAAAAACTSIVQATYLIGVYLRRFGSLDAAGYGAQTLAGIEVIPAEDARLFDGLARTLSNVPGGLALLEEQFAKRVELPDFLPHSALSWGLRTYGALSRLSAGDRLLDGPADVLAEVEKMTDGLLTWAYNVWGAARARPSDDAVRRMLAAHPQAAPVVLWLPDPPGPDLHQALADAAARVKLPADRRGSTSGRSGCDMPTANAEALLAVRSFDLLVWAHYAGWLRVPRLLAAEVPGENEWLWPLDWTGRLRLTGQELGVLVDAHPQETDNILRNGLRMSSLMWLLSSYRALGGAQASRWLAGLLAEHPEGVTRLRQAMVAMQGYSQFRLTRADLDALVVQVLQPQH